MVSPLSLKDTRQEKGHMMIKMNFIPQHKFQSAAGPLAVALALFVAFGPGFSLTARAQGRSSTKPALTADQRIAHFLSRLTFRARPGDFKRVNAIAVNELIGRQLDSHSVDDVGVDAGLGRLPLLGLAAPAIFEQYTPPKPVASRSPAPAKSPDRTAANTVPRIGSEKSDANAM